MSDLDNIVLVDKALKTRFSTEKNILKLGMTLIEAVALLHECNIRFTYGVLINPGVNEGGADYQPMANWSFSLLKTIMDDSFFFLNCPDEHGKRKFKKYFNLPQDAVLLGKTDEGYIDPTIFSDLYKYGKEFCVWKITKKEGTPVNFKLGNRTVTVQRRNIFSATDHEALFVRTSPGEFNNMKAVMPNVHYVKDLSIEQIIQFCNNNRIERIAIAPWLRHSYNSLIQYLERDDTNFPKHLSFLHVNVGDYAQIYKRAEQKTV